MGKPNEPNYYFAYGSNMFEGQMKQRCPSAVFVSGATLHGFLRCFPQRSERWHGGVAGVTAAPDESVEGVVYQLSDSDLLVLDGYEGVDSGRYKREAVEVVLENGGSITAWIYYATMGNGQHYPPSSDYIDTLLKGAVEHRLSEETVQYIVTIKNSGSPERQPPAR